MHKIDFRTIDHKTREDIRKRAVKNIIKGKKPEEIAKYLGCNRSSVYAWYKRYVYEGFKGLSYRKASGDKSKLSDTQKKLIFSILTMEYPEQHNLPFDLWSLSLIRQLLIDQFEVILSDVSISRLLKALNLFPHKKLHHRWKDVQNALDEWISNDIYTIRKEANKVGATIYFVNSTRVVSHIQLQIFSAVSAQGRMRFMVIKGKITSSKFINFMERLIKSEKKPVFLIMDDDPAYRSKRIQAFITQTQAALKVLKLPPAYSQKIAH